MAIHSLPFLTWRQSAVRCSLLLIFLTCYLTTAVHAAHLNRHLGREVYRATSLRSTTLKPRQQSQLTSDIQNLQQTIQGFSNTLNQWLASFLNDYRQVEAGAQSSTAPSSSRTTGTTRSSSRTAGTTRSSSRVSSSAVAASTASRTASIAGASPSSGPVGGQLAVYFGQTPGTTPNSLLPLCQDPSINIINLAFVDALFSSGGYPSLNLGGACWPPNADSAAARAGAQGLLNCTNIGTQIQACQKQYNTKVLLSLGGAYSSSSFPNATAARGLADTLWSLFGPGTALSPGLRPFGPHVILDGFDVDNENHITDYWGDFATQLRSHYTAQQQRTGRKFYLSAAPQCPRPDASIPLSLMSQADYVYVQFYNNPPCDLDSGASFLDSAAAWSSDLARGSTGKQAPRLFIGAGAWPGAGQGYVDPGALGQVVRQAKQRVAGAGNNFGGIMLWDGLVGSQNGYVGAAARALQ